MKSVLAALLLAMLLALPALAEELSPANRLYQQAAVESERASKLERRGKMRQAIDAYEVAGRLSEASLAEAERTGIAEDDRPIEVYFRCATSYLHAGRLLARGRGDDERREDDLAKATTYLDMVEKLETDRARRANKPVNPEIWRVRNAAGYACFLRGELAQARQHYQAVLEMNPTYHSAAQAITEINKLEQEENELFTPQGRTLQKEKTRAVLKSLVEGLRLVRDIVTLGR